MTDENLTAVPAPTARTSPSIKIFGVGTAGINLMESLVAGGLAGPSFVAVNTEPASLNASTAGEKLLLETRLLRGLGTGGDPERGRSAAEENAPRLKALCENAEVIFILAGLGGGAGTGIAPVLARVAKEAGALALAFVSVPFNCEGKRRQTLARQGLDALKAAADGVICLPNQKVCQLIDDNTSVLETFNITNQLFADGVLGVWRLLSHTGLIEIHFSDLSALLRDRHAESSFAVAEAKGPNRSRDVTDKLFAHPMLEGGILAGADAVLVSLIGGPDLTMTEVNRVMEQVHRQCEHAQTVMGAAIAEQFRDRLAVTLIAARKNEPAPDEPTVAPAVGDLETQLLTPEDSPRPGSRFVPPPPQLAPEKMQQLLARQTAGAPRGRKAQSKMRQTTLPLEIISKGRFDKSEPTIHRGEDLDVPTYIRRGVALN